MKLKVFGYEEGDNVLRTLGEVSIAADPKTLRELAKFLNTCATSIENDHENRWDHEHFSDFIRQKILAKSALLSDVIVAHPRLV